MIGRILGNRYEILEEVGKGGMAIVYKAMCLILNRYVAVKVLRPEFREDSEFIKRFKAEAQAAAALSHSNIVSIYDVGTDGDIDYIVMEYVEGVTLKQYIAAKGVIPWKEAVDYAAQICAGLECAHKKGIVHKDIKPHNIIITREGILKITDFGIARAASTSTVATGGPTMGSVHYFSPEQARGGYVDAKSDIYSLGVVLYEMVTGQLPFQGDTPISVAMQHLEKQPAPPSSINPSIPKSLDAVILKAMRKEQSLRYDSVGKMMVDLKKVYLGVAVEETEAFDNGDTTYVPVVDHSRRPSVVTPYAAEEQPDVNGDSVQVRGKMAGKKKGKKLSAKEKKGTIIGVVAGVVLFAIVVLVFYNLLAVNPNNDIELPNLVGKTLTEAEDMLANTRLQLEVERTEENTEEEPGTILSQDPTPKKVKDGSTVKVVVSRGAEEFDAPNLVNMKYDDAQRRLNEYDLKFTIIRETSDTIPADYVIRQNPSSGSPVKEGDTITLYVSDGQDESLVAVPNLIGSTESAAKNMLLNANLTYGEVRSEHSNKPEGTVIRQSIRADLEVKQKTQVDFVISLGPAEPTQEPTTEPTPSPDPTQEPTREPTQAPTASASVEPVAPGA